MSHRPPRTRDPRRTGDIERISDVIHDITMLTLKNFDQSYPHPYRYLMRLDHERLGSCICRFAVRGYGPVVPRERC